MVKVGFQHWWVAPATQHFFKNFFLYFNKLDCYNGQIHLKTSKNSEVSLSAIGGKGSVFCNLFCVISVEKHKCFYLFINLKFSKE